MKAEILVSFLFSFLSRSEDLYFVSRGARQRLSLNVTVSDSNYLKYRRFYFLVEWQRKLKEKLNKTKQKIPQIRKYFQSQLYKSW